MLSFDNIKEYSTDFPKTWSFLWSPEEAENIPQEHKDQIHFLNEEASIFIENYFRSSKMVTGPLWKPFNERYFKTVEEFQVTENCDQEIKKWLYNKGIPFDHYVYIYGDRSDQGIALTWKMVIKYWKGLFFADDLIIFDQTLNWGLFYFHEDTLYFGKDNIYDKNYEYEKTQELNDLKKKFFDKDNLNFKKDEKRQAIKDFKTKHDTDKLE